MNYQEPAELAKASPDNEEFRVSSITIRPLLQDGPQSDDYFETIPEAEAYFDTSVAWDPEEEHGIESYVSPVAWPLPSSRYLLRQRQ